MRYGSPCKAQATHLELIKSAVALASKRSFDICCTSGSPAPETFSRKSGARKKLVQRGQRSQRAVVEASGVRVIPCRSTISSAPKTETAWSRHRPRFYAEATCRGLASARPGQPDSILVGLMWAADDWRISRVRLFCAAKGRVAEISRIAHRYLAWNIAWKAGKAARGSLLVIGGFEQGHVNSRVPLSRDPVPRAIRRSAHMLNPRSSVGANALSRWL